MGGMNKFKASLGNISGALKGGFGALKGGLFGKLGSLFKEPPKWK